MTLKVRVLQHVPFEGPAKIDDWADDRGHELKVANLYAGEPLPALDDLDLLVVMGGPMGANDDARFLWMKPEKDLIRRAIESGKQVLGICLGAQLMAAALGGRVQANPEKEIGWFPIELDPPNVRHHPLNVLPQRVTVFHWHGDTFTLPKGAVHLARSRACENQAFAVGSNAVGLQFHIEMALPQIEQILLHGAADLTGGAFIQDPNDMLALAPQQAPPLNAALFRFLDAFTTRKEALS